MKIIGTSEGGYICDVSVRELAVLSGHSGEWQAPRLARLLGRSERADALLGCRIKVIDRWNRVTELERKHGRLSDLSSNLRAVASLIDTLATPPLTPPPAPAAAEASQGDAP